MSLETGIITLAEVIGADVRELKTGKVDKVAGKGLSDTNFTQAEKTKLGTVAASATANRADNLNADKVHTHTTAQVTGLDTALEGKVDKVSGKGLSSTDFTQVEKTKLAGVATGATANRADSLNADKTHTHTTAQVTGLDTALGTKVDKVAGKVLSDTNFTQAEKDKLSSLASSKFVGLFVSEGALPATGSAGDYANVDGGVGSDVYRVIWDSSDSKWVTVQGVSTDLTDAQIKQQYENNPDTNAFTDTEKSKLAGVAVGATANRADSLNANKTHTHAISEVTGLATRLSDIDDLISGVESGLDAIIDDTAGAGAAGKEVTWSADKTVTAIQAAVDALVDGAPAELNTINKLATAVANDENLTQTMITQINNRVRFDAAQALTAEQQLIACANIGVGDPTRDFASYYEAAKL